ncbi:hypothetical protein VTL71DRAFT_12041 [Oculimacula yallundae]|uniref:Uncharacterized protein n=1 Tax=Oculimacula yallundae TaxID=86028 RepID=A0ABR4CTL0_9HELO
MSSMKLLFKSHVDPIEMSSYSHVQQQPPPRRINDNVSLLSQYRSSSPEFFPKNNVAVQEIPLRSSTSKSSSPTPVIGWPDQPQNLRKTASEIWLNIAIEVFLVAVSLPLLALAIAIVYYKDRIVVDSEWTVFKQIINSTKVGTAFPYVFGIVVGRAMKLFGAWRLEKGVSLGILEQIMGSTTLGSTLTTHTLLRPFNFATLGLFTLWIFSPIGSRVSLGLIEPKLQPVVTNTTVQYLNSRQASKFYSESPEDQLEIIAGPINALYTSSLMAPDSAKMSSMDQWGNIKIPYFDRINANFTADSTGWISLSDHQAGNITYSSLLGIPFSKPIDDKVSNLTWTMSTTYLSLNCHTMTREPLIPLNVKLDTDNTTWSSLSTSPSSLFSLAMNGFISPNKTLESSHSISSFMTATNASSIPHTLLFQSPIWTDDLSANATANLTMAGAYCDLSQQYVDVEVHCSGTQDCGVIAMRESLAPHAPKEFTVLGFDLGFKMLSYLLPLATGESVTGGSLPQSTATELFLSGTSATLSHLTKVDLSQLTPSEMEVRLGQVLNTYYTASLSPYSLTGNLLPSLPTSSSTLTISTPALSTTFQNRYSVNPKWLSLYFISCTVLLLAVLSGIILKNLVVAPDILGWVSSLTRDNPYMREAMVGGGTAMGGWKRARVLEKMRIKIGDMGSRRYGEVGYIAVATEGEARALEKERFYL